MFQSYHFGWGESPDPFMHACKSKIPLSPRNTLSIPCIRPIGAVSSLPAYPYNQPHLSTSTSTTTTTTTSLRDRFPPPPKPLHLTPLLPPNAPQKNIMTRIPIPIFRMKTPRPTPPILLRRPIHIPAIPEWFPGHIPFSAMRVIQQVLLWHVRVESTGQG